MNADFLMNLPASLRDIRVRPLFVMRLDVRPLQIIGHTPSVFRRVGVVTGGNFTGRRLSGEVLEGGSDWQAVGSEAGTTLDVRLVLKAADGALIGMTYRGIRHGPAEVIARLERGEVVEPDAYYFRIAPLFETADKNLSWLNKIIAVGTGHRLADGPVYSVFEVI